MDRFIVPSQSEAHEVTVARAMLWLMDNGGGTLVMEQKSNLVDAFELWSGKQYERMEAQLRERGVRIAFARGGNLPQSGNVVAASCMRKTIEELDAHTGIERLAVLAWHASDWEDWAQRYSPVVLELPPLGE